MKKSKADGEGRLIAIGDVHGHAAKLQELLDAVRPRHSDTIVFLGDYVDRGPNSCGVLQQIVELADSIRLLVPLRGNHEQWMLDAAKETRAVCWYGFGGRETIASYRPETVEEIEQLLATAELPHQEPLPLRPFFESVPVPHLRLLKRTVLYHEEPGFLFVHAGIVPGVPMSEQRRPTLLMGDHRFFDRYKGKRTVVFGHYGTPHLRKDGKPLPYAPRRRNIIGLDTLVYETGVLTAMEVRTRRTWQTQPFDGT